MFGSWKCGTYCRLSTNLRRLGGRSTSPHACILLIHRTHPTILPSTVARCPGSWLYSTASRKMHILVAMKTRKKNALIDVIDWLIDAYIHTVHLLVLSVYPSMCLQYIYHSRSHHGSMPRTGLVVRPSSMVSFSCPGFHCGPLRGAHPPRTRCMPLGMLLPRMTAMDENEEASE